MSNFLVVLKKELMDLFRDKKTLIFTILLPVIMYPVMFKIIDTTMKDTQNSVTKNITIAYKGDTESSIYKMLKGSSNITIDNEGNVEDKLNKGKLSLIVDVPKDFDSKVISEGQTDLKIVYDENSNKSAMAASALREMLDGYSKSIVDSRLQAKGISTQVLTPFEIKQETLWNKKDNPMGAAILNILPTILIIFMISPTIGIAADLVAGEKERGTFEPLLSTAVGRTSIFWGKLGAIASVAFITLITSVAAMLGSMMYIFSTGSSLSIPIGAFGVIAVIAIFVLVALSSLEIAISIFARSVKEANTYLSGLLIPVMILTYIPFMMDAKSIGILFFNIPIVNAVVVMKEAIAGIFNPAHLGIVLGWHIVYVIVSVIFARYMFSREEVVFRS
ncbi:ABC transporter permease [Clostridium paridis]|uniref:ABC transporter permease n=1 Tax=Clostridium paridis TaxID=2803863 RepID=A0A937K4M4_9CLOT|nr:ABC transporter permease [Clostridium paridis]MBL4931380.1 ABC transporter permease [Clostridium paridis]